MRVSVLVASVLLCSSSSACSTKKKLDNVLDNANKTINNANKRINELSDLADSLKSDLSDAVKQSSAAASQTLASIGAAAGDVPATGGEVKGTEQTADLDDDGKPDQITAVEYPDKMLWLVDASTLADLKQCQPQMFFVTDKPPEHLSAWGVLSESCGGTMTCPPSEAEKDSPDFDNCSCQDAKKQAIACDAFLKSLAGSQAVDPEQTSDAGSGSLVACDDGTQTIPESAVCDGTVDCKDGSDEAAMYCSSANEDQVVCDDGKQVIAASVVCDGRTDCKDGSDEAAMYCGG